MKPLEEVYIYNNDKVIGIAKLYANLNLPYRFYDMDKYNKIKKG